MLSDLLKSRTIYKLEQINQLNREIERIELDTIEEYFQIIYQDRSGYMKGIVVRVEGVHVIIDVFEVNGVKDRWVKGFRAFKASEIDLI